MFKRIFTLTSLTVLSIVAESIVIDTTTGFGTAKSQILGPQLTGSTLFSSSLLSGGASVSAPMIYYNALGGIENAGGPVVKQGLSANAQAFQNAVCSLVIDEAAEFSNAGLLGVMRGSSSGSITIFGGSITNNSKANFGKIHQNASGFITISDSAKILNQGFFGQVSDNANGNIDISGGVLTNDASAEFASVQNQANLDLSIKDSAWIVNSGYLAKLDNQATGSITLSGGFLSNEESGHFLKALSSANASVIIKDQAFVANSGFILNLNDQSEATVTISGGSILNNGSGHFITLNHDSLLTLLIDKDAFIASSGQFAEILHNSTGSITIKGGYVQNNESGQFANTSGNGLLNLLITDAADVVSSGVLARLSHNATGSVTISGGSFTNKQGATLLEVVDASQGSLVFKDGAYIKNAGAIGHFYGASSGSITFDHIDLVNKYAGNIAKWSNGTSDVMMIKGGNYTNHDGASIATAFNSTNTSLLISDGARIENNGYMGVLKHHSQGLISLVSSSLVNHKQLAVFHDRSLGNLKLVNSTIINNGLIGHGIHESISQVLIDKVTIINNNSLLKFKDFSEASITLYQANITNSGNSFFIQAEDKASCVVNLEKDSSITNRGYFASGSDLSSLHVNFNASSLSNNPYADFGLRASTIKINGGSIINHSNAHIARDALLLTISAGSITNSGGYIGQGVKTTRMTGGSIINSFTGNLFGNTHHDQTGSLFILGGSINNSGFVGYNKELVSIQGGEILNTGFLFDNVDLIQMSGGSIKQTEGFFALTTKNRFELSGGSINSDFESFMGPFELHMKGGFIKNDGIIALDKIVANPFPNNEIQRVSSHSYINDGLIEGRGQIWIAGEATLNKPLSQGLIKVGYGLISKEGLPFPAGVTQGKLYLNSDVNATVEVTSLGTLQGSGRIQGDLRLNSGGCLSPFNTASGYGIFRVAGNVVFGEGSKYLVNFNKDDHAKIIIEDGFSLSLDKVSSPIIEYSLEEPVQEGTIFNLVSLESQNDKRGLIYGEFTAVGSQPLVDLQLIKTQQGLDAKVNYKSFHTIARSDNQHEIATALDGEIYSSAMGASLQDLRTASLTQLGKTMQALDVGPFKAQSIAIEEMSFIINDEFSQQLYKYSDGFRPFLAFGYESISRGKSEGLTGFNSNNFFELIGTSYGKNQWQLTGALGALQSSARANSQKARTSDEAILAAFGGSGFIQRWSFGADVLFGYHFLNTKRKSLLPYYVAKSSHQGFNVKSEIHLEYTKTFDTCLITPYESFGYNYYQEDSFTESGGGIYDNHVEISRRNMIRNTIGMKSEFCLTKAHRPYVDVSYVYEYRYTGLNYQTRFVNSSTTMEEKGPRMPTNFGKLSFGVNGSKNNWDYRFNFTGLFSTKFVEAGLSCYFDYKF